MNKKRFVKTISMIMCSIMFFSVMNLSGFASESGSTELFGITIGNLSIMNFQSSVTEYDVELPYSYAENDFETVNVPEIKAYPKDSNAVVSVTPPSDINGSAVIVVTNGENSAVYTLNFKAVGLNMVTDGGMETDAWLKHNRWGLACITSGSVSDEAPLAGNAAFRYVPASIYSIAENPGNGIKMESGVKYLVTYGARNPNSDNVSYYGSQANLPSDTVKTFYNSDGTKRDGDGLGKLSSSWTRVIQTYLSDAGGESVRFGPINFDGLYTVELDEMYIAPVSINEINYTGEKIVVVPTEGSKETELAAELKNQIGGNQGIEELMVNYRLLNELQGVSVENGVLKVDSDAAEGTVYLEMCVPHSLNGKDETAANIVPIEIKGLSEAKSDLLDIKLGSLSIANFNPLIKEYNVKVPYRYIEGDFETVNMPEVGYLAADENAVVDIEYPQKVDGHSIVIRVSCDGEESVYKINMAVVGMNMYKDGGFETPGWVDANKNRTVDTDGFDGSSVANLSEYPKAGKYSLQYAVPYAKFVYPIEVPKLNPGITYLHSAYFRLVSGEISSLYNGSSGSTARVHYNENGTIKAGDNIGSTGYEWTRLISSHRSDSLSDFYISPFSYDNNKLTAAIDDYYLAPMVITGITYTGGSLTVKIPENEGEVVKIPLSAKMTNGIGGIHGLEDSSVEFGLASNYRGVSIKDNSILEITQDATESPIILTMTAKTSFESTQGIIMNTAYGKLIAASEDANIPKVRHLKISRVPEISEYKLDGYYEFYHSYGKKEGASKIEWQHKSEDKDEFERIEGADGVLELIVPERYKNDSIRLAVVPQTEDGTEGDIYYSNVILKPTKPIANDVVICGNFAVGEELNGSYSYFDANGDEEDTPEYAWYISDLKDGIYTEIQNENKNKYTVKETDINKYIMFGVKPKAKIAPFDGNICLSSPKLCAAYPVASDVKISQVGSKTYRVSYKYNHETGIGEGNTSVQWYADGQFAGKEAVLTVSKLPSMLEVRVMPIAVKKPYEGKCVSAFLSIEGRPSDGVIRSGGGGGGGGGGRTYKMVPIPEPTEKSGTEDVKMPEKYWAEDGINFVLSKGIMHNKAKDDFGNREYVSRSEFVHYLIKSLGEDERAYNFEFEDVSGDDYYAGAVQKAVDMGIISKDTFFEPLRNLSRQELSKIIVIAVGKTKDEIPDIDKFEDSEKIEEWARGYVSEAVKCGLLKGVSETEFDPYGFVTREQTAVIMHRIAENKNGGSL